MVHVESLSANEHDVWYCSTRSDDEMDWFSRWECKCGERSLWRMSTKRVEREGKEHVFNGNWVEFPEA